MNGIVDESLRALLDISVAATRAGEMQAITAWVDTAFNGGLAIPRQHIERLGLRKASAVPAILADGSSTDLETFICHVEWFGSSYRTQVVASDGQFPLLGTVLLANRKLAIDYEMKTLVLD